LKEKFWEKNLGGIKINEIWRERYNNELMRLFWELDIFLFVRICRLNWIGFVNRMDSKRKLGQVFKNNPQGIQLRG
jgi:hypothetical protein